MIENVKCPKCGGPMVARKSGRDGRMFFGCKAFPECRGTRNTDGEAPRRYGAGADDDDIPADVGLPSERQRNADRSRWRL
jgi:ssDNA-binding Zn-finger/Zn-ribbon topoisomerase 1